MQASQNLKLAKNQIFYVDNLILYLLAYFIATADFDVLGF